MPDSGQSCLPSGNLSQALESLKGPSGHGELWGSEPAVGEGLLVSPLILPLLPSCVPYTELH